MNMAATYSSVQIAIGIVQYHSSASWRIIRLGGSVWEEGIISNKEQGMKNKEVGFSYFTFGLYLFVLN
jgi:hypothetical protein